MVSCVPIRARDALITCYVAMIEIIFSTAKHLQITNVQQSASYPWYQRCREPDFEKYPECRDRRAPQDRRQTPKSGLASVICNPDSRACLSEGQNTTPLVRYDSNPHVE